MQTIVNNFICISFIPRRTFVEISYTKYTKRMSNFSFQAELSEADVESLRKWYKKKAEACAKYIEQLKQEMDEIPSNPKYTCTFDRNKARGKYERAIERWEADREYYVTHSTAN